MEYINYSGGAKGADTHWENVGKIFGVKTIAHSFPGHNTKSKSTNILTIEELDEGWEKVSVAAEALKRPLGGVSTYVKNLLSRNWFQIKNTQSVYAIGLLLRTKEWGYKHINATNGTIVDGGTGYAVMMAIQHNIPVYVFDQKRESWYKWIFDHSDFLKMSEVPMLTEKFTGIGTRVLTDGGKSAILSAYKTTFNTA